MIFRLFVVPIAGKSDIPSFEIVTEAMPLSEWVIVRIS